MLAASRSFWVKISEKWPKMVKMADLRRALTSRQTRKWAQTIAVPVPGRNEASIGVANDPSVEQDKEVDGARLSTPEFVQAAHERADVRDLNVLNDAPLRTRDQCLASWVLVFRVERCVKVVPLGTFGHWYMSPSTHLWITVFQPPVDRPPSTFVYVHQAGFYVPLHEAYTITCVELNLHQSICVYTVNALRPTLTHLDLGSF
ncbi:hypothetical protein K438DRAFT_1755511 [Mycena galopus ATCC 62051]|nr:hypothetical protein K438DRAFT_1755511 [Mycena galopus ATCC 62051]